MLTSIWKFFLLINSSNMCASRVKFSSFTHALLISYVFLNIYLFAISFAQRTLAPLNGHGGNSRDTLPWQWRGLCNWNGELKFFQSARMQH
jgi:hypothetical protein